MPPTSLLTRTRITTLLIKRASRELTALVGTGPKLGPHWGIPPLQGSRGHVPSHVSLATGATSVVANSGYFGNARRTLAESHGMHAM